jgi:predicted nucleic acid-binding protein
MIVVDTSVLTEIFDKKSTIGEKALEKILRIGEEIAITVINLHEILYGLQKYAKPVREILRLPVLSFHEKGCDHSGKIRAWGGKERSNGAANGCHDSGDMYKQWSSPLYPRPKAF